MRVRRALVVALAIVFSGPMYITLDGLLSRPRDADVAIVFGNTVTPDGRPSSRLKARLDAALDLHRARRVRRIFVSGGTGKEGVDESVVMKRYLVAAGVPDSLVIADGAGINTAATCANARAFMAANGLVSADVVSQFFHLTRAKLTCRRAGIELAGAVAPRWFEPRDVYSLARETIAVPVYWVRRRG